MSYEVIETIATKELWSTSKWSMDSSKVPTASQTGWSVTNLTEDRTINADGAVAEIGDGLCQLITDLIAKGVITA